MRARARGERDERRFEGDRVCPYCRDAVSPDDAVVCKRPGCDTLYHTECWTECVSRYGGCAVYGCGARRALALGEAAERHVELLRRRRRRARLRFDLFAVAFLLAMLAVPIGLAWLESSRARRVATYAPVVETLKATETVKPLPPTTQAAEPAEKPRVEAPKPPGPCARALVTSRGSGGHTLHVTGCDELDGTPCEWNVDTPEEEGVITAFELSPDGKRLVTTASRTNSARLFLLDEGKWQCSHVLSAHEGRIAALRFDTLRFEGLVLTGGFDGTAYVWPLGWGERVDGANRVRPYCPASYSPASKTFAWVERGALRALRPHGAPVILPCSPEIDGVFLSPGASRVACLEKSRKVRVLPISVAGCVKTFELGDDALVDPSRLWWNESTLAWQELAPAHEARKPVEVVERHRLDVDSLAETFERDGRWLPIAPNAKTVMRTSSDGLTEMFLPRYALGR